MPMPTFYLNIRDHGDLIKDPEGAEFPDVASVREEAILAAREIVADHLLQGRLEVLDKTFEVTYGAGAIVLTMPFADAVSAPAR